MGLWPPMLWGVSFAEHTGKCVFFAKLNEWNDVDDDDWREKVFGSRASSFSC